MDFGSMVLARCCFTAPLSPARVMYTYHSCFAADLAVSPGQEMGPASTQDFVVTLAVLSR